MTHSVTAATPGNFLFPDDQRIRKLACRCVSLNALTQRNDSVLFLLLFVFIQTPEEEDDEEKEQDKANRTARVQPTPQTRDALAESPNTPNADRRKYEAKQEKQWFYIMCN